MRRGWQRRGAKRWDQGKEWKFETNRRARRMDTELARNAKSEPEEDVMTDDLLRATQAARRLGISTEELLRLVYDRKIRYVMVDGIAHIPADAVMEYEEQRS